jgi:hypothetical protein
LWCERSVGESGLCGCIEEEEGGRRKEEGGEEGRSGVWASLRAGWHGSADGGAASDVVTIRGVPVRYIRRKLGALETTVAHEDAHEGTG